MKTDGSSLRHSDNDVLWAVLTIKCRMQESIVCIDMESHDLVNVALLLLGWKRRQSNRGTKGEECKKHEIED